MENASPIECHSNLYSALPAPVIQYFLGHPTWHERALHEVWCLVVVSSKEHWMAYNWGNYIGQVVIRSCYKSCLLSERTFCFVKIFVSGARLHVTSTTLIYKEVTYFPAPLCSTLDWTDWSTTLCKSNTAQRSVICNPDNLNPCLLYIINLKSNSVHLLSILF